MSQWQTGQTERGGHWRRLPGSGGHEEGRRSVRTVWQVNAVMAVIAVICLSLGDRALPRRSTLLTVPLTTTGLSPSGPSSQPQRICRNDLWDRRVLLIRPKVGHIGTLFWSGRLHFAATVMRFIRQTNGRSVMTMIQEGRAVARKPRDAASFCLHPLTLRLLFKFTIY